MPLPLPMSTDWQNCTRWCIQTHSRQVSFVHHYYTTCVLMKEILIACGDTDLLRTLVGDLPPDQFKPIATRRGAGIVAKLGGRSLSLAIVHADLEDGAAQQLLAELRAFDAQLPILYLSAQKPPAASSSQSGKQPGEQTLFDTALQYPL